MGRLIDYVPDSGLDRRPHPRAGFSDIWTVLPGPVWLALVAVLTSAAAYPPSPVGLLPVYVAFGIPLGILLTAGLPILSSLGVAVAVARLDRRYGAGRTRS